MTFVGVEQQVAVLHQRLTTMPAVCPPAPTRNDAPTASRSEFALEAAALCPAFSAWPR